MKQHDSFFEWLDRNHSFLFGVIVVLCCLTRLLFLGDRPVMHDESLFAYYAEFQFHRQFEYVYLPILHGPLMLYLQGIIFWIFGASDYTMRLGAALLGIGGIFWIRALRPWLGNFGYLISSAFYLTSPMLMFYQRFMRNDSLFIFLTLWIIVSFLYFARTFSLRWMISFLVSMTLLYCNKESSVFITFTLITFLLLLIIYDTAESKQFTVSRPLLDRIRPVPTALFGGAIFFTIVIIQTQVFEGISYDADVQADLGKDFVLANINSLSILVGGSTEIEGPLGSQFFWLIYYALLYLGSLGLAYGANFLIAMGWGKDRVLPDLGYFFKRYQWILITTIFGCLFLYTLLFTTFFQYPESPFSIYQRTLAYWMGQNAVHRIEGPFHYHLINLLIYELPLMLLVISAVIYQLSKLKTTYSNFIPYVLLCGFFLVLHVIFFRHLENQPIIFLIPISLFLLSIALITIIPNTHRIVASIGLVFVAIWTFEAFRTNSFQLMAALPVMKGDKFVESSLWEYLYEQISIANVYHVMMIVIPTFAILFVVWSLFAKKRKMEALMFWWFVTMYGATSYAREKVPWVGIHNVLPLLLIAGIVAQQVKDFGSKFWRYGMMALLGLALLWNTKNAITVCFVHKGDVRERMVYGHSTEEFHAYVNLILDAQKVAGLNATHSISSQYPLISQQPWLQNYNDPSKLKDFTVYVGHEEMHWPLYWYFRDTKMDTTMGVEQAMEQKIPFMFLKPEQVEENPSLATSYHLIRARFRMHWTPEPLSERNLLGIWRLGIPGYERTPESIEGRRLQQSKDEWGSIWDYMIHRKVMANPDPNFSVVEYVFAARKNDARVEVP